MVSEEPAKSKKFKGNTETTDELWTYQSKALNGWPLTL